MIELELCVDRPAGVPVAVAIARWRRIRGQPIFAFDYAPDWVASPGGYAIDPAVPLAGGTQTPYPLPGALRDASPDGWGTALLRSAQGGVQQRTGTTLHAAGRAGDLLNVHDRHRQGALRFRHLGEDGFLAAGDEAIGVGDLDLALRLTSAIEADRHTSSDEAEQLVALGAASLGGARPKVPVRLADGRAAIAKLPSIKDRWDVLAWEHLALTLAAEVGIRATEHALVDVDDQRVLLVTRFDRTADGARIGYLSAKSLLELEPGDQGAYDDIAAAISAHGAASRADRLELLDRMIFNVAIGNTDDHLRNHGFLAAPGGWRLSPAFDLTVNPVDDERGTWISARDSAVDDAAALRMVASRMGVPDEHVRARMLAIADLIAERWDDVAAEAHVTDSDFSLMIEPLLWRTKLVRDAAAGPSR